MKKFNFNLYLEINDSKYIFFVEKSDGENYFESANIIWNAKIRYLGVGAMVVGGIWSVIQLAKPLIESIQLSLKTLQENSDNISLEERDGSKSLTIKSLVLV